MFRLVECLFAPNRTALSYQLTYPSYLETLEVPALETSNHPTMAFCHHCDMTALGCSGCGSAHTGLTTHHGQFLGLASRILSGKVVLNELSQHLSAALLDEESPHKVNIDESLRNGTLCRFSRCLLSAAIQEYALKVSQEALPAIERMLIEDEEAKARARQAAEEAAIERARLVALKAAEETAHACCHHDRE